MSLFGCIFGKKPKNSPVLEPIEPQAEAPFVPDWPLSDAHIEELLRKTFPSWLIIAEGELNVREIPGSDHNPRIVEYHQATSLKATTDEVPWCASFVNWCLLKAEQPRTSSAAARSFLGWGLQLEEPWLGCIAILRRGTSETQGHVGFYVGEIERHILLLGGNQSNKVQVDAYPMSQLLGYRWPVGGEPIV